MNLCQLIFICTAALVAIGLVTLFDIQLAGFPDVRGIADRQIQYALLGFAVMCFCSCIPARALRRIAKIGMIASVAIMSISALYLRYTGDNEIYSAIPLWGGRSIQPAEFARPFLILYLAAALSEYRLKVKSFFRESLFLFLPCAACFISAAVIQGDNGSALVTLLGSLLFLLLAEVPLRHIGLFALFALGPILFLLCWFADTAGARIEIFWRAIGSFTRQHYQVQMVLRSWVESPWAGMGPGNSIQKYYLPKCHSDFILPIVFQDFGLAGLIAVLVMLAGLLFTGLLIARRAANRFEGLFAGGITSMLFAQFALAVMVNICLIPTTGITLPLLSSGGSSLISTLASLGLLVGIARRSDPRARSVMKALRLDGSISMVSFVVWKQVAAVFIIRTKILNLLHHPLATVRGVL